MRIWPAESRRIPATFGRYLISLGGMELRKCAAWAAIALAGISFWCFWLWRPEHQVRLHQQNLLKVIESRNWEKAAGFFDEKYADRWGDDKANVLRGGREALSQFLALGLTGEPAEIVMDGDRARVMATIRIQGSGGPLATIVSERVNALKEPFEFDWIHRSAKPWDWALARVDQPELEFSGVELP